jgi:hypothetical protein
VDDWDGDGVDDIVVREHDSTEYGKYMVRDGANNLLYNDMPLGITCTDDTFEGGM